MLSRDLPSLILRVWPGPTRVPQGGQDCPAQPRSRSSRPGVMGAWWVLPQLPWGVGLRTVGQWGPSVPKAAQVTSAAREGPSSARMLDLALGETSTEPWWVRCCPVCPDTAQGLLLPLPSSLHWAPGAAGPAPALPRPFPQRQILSRAHGTSPGLPALLGSRATAPGSCSKPGHYSRSSSSSCNPDKSLCATRKKSNRSNSDAHPRARTVWGRELGQESGF